MTPQEKAKEIFERFISLDAKCKTGFMSNELSKKCAIVAVELVLNTNKDKSIYGTEFSNYWNEVLTEIENL